jgi:hypothetical protein
MTIIKGTRQHREKRARNILIKPFATILPFPFFMFLLPS